MARQGTYRRDPAIPFQQIEGETVVIVPARRELHQLDAVGAFFWEALRERRTLDQLVRKACGEFDVTPGTARSHIRGFLREMEGRGLLLRS